MRVQRRKRWIGIAVQNSQESVVLRVVRKIYIYFFFYFRSTVDLSFGFMKVPLLYFHIFKYNTSLPKKKVGLKIAAKRVRYLDFAKDFPHFSSAPLASSRGDSGDLNSRIEK